MLLTSWWLVLHHQCVDHVISLAVIRVWLMDTVITYSKIGNNFFLAKSKSWERERDSGPTVPAKWRTALWELKQINPNFMSKFESVPSCKMFNVHIGKLIVAMHFNKGKTNDICFWKWFSRFGGFFSSNFQVVFHLLPDVVYLHIYDYAVYILIRMKAHNQQLQGQLSFKVALYPQAMWYSG